jgi:acylphosphatase
VGPEAGDLIRKRLNVHGRVQGVGFRVFVARAAQTRAVGGWVRNRWNGTVEVVLEGEREAVESVVRLCREGPRGASVTQVEELDEQPDGLRGFEVR